MGGLAEPVESGRDRAAQALLTGLAPLAQVFWGPEEELCRDMASGDFRDDLAALGPRLDRTGWEAAEMMADLVQGREPEELRSVLEDRYLQLFVTSREGIAASLCHSHCESPDGSLMGRPYEMMRRRLEPAGIDPAGPSNEPADHLAVETEYLFLVLESGWVDQDRDLLALGLYFSGQEMLPWVGELARRLEREDPQGFYLASARLLVSTLQALTAALRAGPGLEKS